PDLTSLLNHHGFISAGHDEYWSMAMYNAVARARDSGVNLAFLGADDVSWQVRYGPSASGAPDRVLICYKSASLDPVQNNTTTVHFRDPQVNMPEQLLVGGPRPVSSWERAVPHQLHTSSRMHPVGSTPTPAHS